MLFELLLSAIISIITINAAQVNVHRNVKQDGFHRDLVTVVHFSTEKQILDKLKLFPCQIMLLEHLPSGIYIDPYQVELLSSDHEVLIDGDIDVEAPEYLSSPVDVYVFTTLSTDKIIIELPIHVRYHKPSNSSSYTSISIENPHLYFYCSHLSDNHPPETLLAPCNIMNSSRCHWKRIIYPIIESVNIQVPVGLSWHNMTVTIMTLMITTAGCTLLIWKMLNTTVVSRKKH